VVADIIDYDLDVLFVGINPGVKSSERSHHFAGPTNHFWPCLSDSGRCLLPPGVRLGPNDDRSLPAICNMGLTNLVDRPSRMGDELSVAECRAAAPILTAKIKKYRPRFVCFVSKQAWDMYSGVGLGLQTAWVSWYNEVEDGNFPVLGQNDNDDDGGIYAIQNNLEAEGYRVRGSRMFVMPSTSGRVTQYRREDKLAFFKQLAELVRKDRQVRGVKDPWEL
ncbi:uracil-DNA glycosylase-like protein, partial [Dissophora ornata]